MSKGRAEGTADAAEYGLSACDSVENRGQLVGKSPPHFGIEGYPPEQVGYHAHIMMQEGLIEGIDVTNSESEGPEIMPMSLTWKGHELLDLARDPERWSRARAIIARIGGAPISVGLKVLTDLTVKGIETARPR